VWDFGDELVGRRNQLCGIALNLVTNNNLILRILIGPGE